jgi:hypothetical protein
MEKIETKKNNTEDKPKKISKNTMTVEGKKEYMKSYMKVYLQQKVVCSCGTNVTKSWLCKHKQTPSHKNKLIQYQLYELERIEHFMFNAYELECIEHEKCNEEKDKQDMIRLVQSMEHISNMIPKIKMQLAQ